MVKTWIHFRRSFRREMWSQRVGCNADWFSFILDPKTHTRRRPYLQLWMQYFAWCCFSQWFWHSEYIVKWYWWNMKWKKRSRTVLSSETSQRIANITSLNLSKEERDSLEYRLLVQNNPHSELFHVNEWGRIAVRGEEGGQGNNLRIFQRLPPQFGRHMQISVRKRLQEDSDLYQRDRQERQPPQFPRPPRPWPWRCLRGPSPARQSPSPGRRTRTRGPSPCRTTRSSRGTRPSTSSSRPAPWYRSSWTGNWTERHGPPIASRY